MNFQNKIVLITGGGSGIGQKLCLAMLKKGARVAIVGRHKEDLEETKSLAGDDSDKISIHTADVTDRSTVEALPEEVIKHHGAIDVVINNAGIIQPFIKVVDLDYQSIEKVMNVNFYGTLYVTKAFLPHLLKRPEAYLVNISSMGGFLPVPGQSIYGASKAAIKLFTEGLYAELKNTNVRVSVVFPGAVNTEIAKHSGVDISQATLQKNIPILSPDEAAHLIIRGMEKEKFQIFLGKDCNFMNKLYRLCPRFATDYIAKKMGFLLETAKPK